MPEFWSCLLKGWMGFRVCVLGELPRVLEYQGCFPRYEYSGGAAQGKGSTTRFGSQALWHCAFGFRFESLQPPLPSLLLYDGIIEENAFAQMMVQKK